MQTKKIRKTYCIPQPPLLFLFNHFLALFALVIGIIFLLTLSVHIFRNYKKKKGTLDKFTKIIFLNLALLALYLLTYSFVYFNTKLYILSLLVLSGGTLAMFLYAKRKKLFFVKKTMLILILIIFIVLSILSSINLYQYGKARLREIKKNTALKKTLQEISHPPGTTKQAPEEFLIPMRGEAVIKQYKRELKGTWSFLGEKEDMGPIGEYKYHNLYYKRGGEKRWAVLQFKYPVSTNETAPKNTILFVSSPINEPCVPSPGKECLLNLGNPMGAFYPEESWNTQGTCSEQSIF